jgi:cell division transport system permease protein
MKTILYNLMYYIKETVNMLRMNLLSNIASLLSTGLILFVLGLVFTGWSISNGLVDRLKEEAEISVYLKENIDNENVDIENVDIENDDNENVEKENADKENVDKENVDKENDEKENTDKDNIDKDNIDKEKVSIKNANKLLTDIRALQGVWDARLVDEKEAYTKMENVLGEESEILTLFDENPFEAYLEVRIQIESMDTVIDQIGSFADVDFIRDNREMLTRIQKITMGIRIIGVLSLAAVGITTIVILSHLIRQGIYNNKDEINTLKLLGAPNYFISFPFLIYGLLLTLCGGAIAIMLLHILIHYGFGKVNEAISFIPMPDADGIKRVITSMILIISLVLGLLGSLVGVASIRKDS